MNFNIEIRGNTLVVFIKGELDDHVAKMLRDKLDFILLRKEIKNVIFDLKDLTLMDSAGIGLLIGRYKIIKARDGQAYLILNSDSVKKILKMSGVLNLFKCFETSKDALNEIEKRAVI